MRYSSFLATSALALAGFSNGLNILLNNDDGFGSGNLRLLYNFLKAAGHNGMFHFFPLTSHTIF
jgi:5'-nucleotidase